jgi:decaprenyl-phosphate phosphoribosyltransferase
MREAARYTNECMKNNFPVIKQYIISVRPFQWVKNLLVFTPLFFVGGINDSVLFGKALVAFFVFSFVSSSVYVWNDICDRETDSNHPTKKHRPIASGAISLRSAYIYIAAIICAALGSLFFVPSIVLPVGIYLLLNVAYSQYLKHVAVVDVVCVALFYLLRIYAGGAATFTYVSEWIILCTFFGSLFVILGKRKAEYAHEVRRKVLKEYSLPALDMMLAMSAALSIISYGIYSLIGHDSPHLVYSTIFVLFALFRMFNHIYTHPLEAESPEILVFKDRWILGAFIGWVVYVFLVFYLY